VVVLIKSVLCEYLFESWGNTGAIYGKSEFWMNAQPLVAGACALL
jgi:hypothetical protein